MTFLRKLFGASRSADRESDAKLVSQSEIKEFEWRDRLPSPFEDDPSKKVRRIPRGRSFAESEIFRTR
jgi:hypothetical protein